MKLLRLLVIPMLLAVGACVTVPPPTISVDEIASYKLAAVEVQGAEAVRSWPAQEEAYLASGKADPEVAKRLPSEGVQSFPPVQAYIRTALEQRFNAELGAQLAPVLRGPRAVRILVKLQELDIPSGARKALVDSEAKLKGGIDIVDAKTGDVILSYPGPLKSVSLGPTVLLGVIGGVGAIAAAGIRANAAGVGSNEPGSALIGLYVTDYRKWLVER